MSRSNWLYVAAVGGCVTVLAIGWARNGPGTEVQTYVPNLQPIGPFKECQTEPQQPNAGGSSHNTKPPSPREPYGPNTSACQKATSDAERQQEEVELQRRAALAAENSVAISLLQSRWAVLEFFALLATLGIAGIALSDGRRHSTAELRAYLSLTDVTLLLFHPGQHPTATFKIFNSGATPAYKMRYRAGLEAFPHPYVGDISREFAPKDEIDPGISVASQGHSEGEAIMYKPLTPEDHAAVRSGTKALYLVATVEYCDAFGFERKTRFCAWVGGREFAAADDAAKARNETDFHISWTMTKAHNEAD